MTEIDSFLARAARNPDPKPGTAAAMNKRLRDSQRLRVVCGWRGCRRSFQGSIDETQDALAEHRRERHPDFVEYERPRVPPSARREFNAGRPRRSRTEIEGLGETEDEDA